MKLLHIYCYFGEQDDDCRRRIEVAHKSWINIGADETIEVTSSDVGRDGRAIDPEFPAWFASDIIDAGFRKSCLDDIMFVTSSDVGFMPGTREAVIGACGSCGSCHLRKRNFHRIEYPFTDDITRGGNYPGMDACAFTVNWWRAIRQRFPDVLYGRQHWDCVMRNIIRASGGTEIRDMEWHEEHLPLWWSGKTNRANLYNERLACRWIGEHGGSTQDHNYTTEELGYK